ncbi:IclR family transcriptional regulator [Roseovarius indicus]|uniref:Acetate operon repressor n=1 Tax=Roseovarius indicus TaxID=540747 RepID=A0A5P3A835_9RHOB|nr:IclR family transcriptional regulator [Roseovarius indicus]QEW25552.1 Acetate operon repressor [Roseovarius indicus]SFE03163.1 transcriptional regulator, IclR family [Roseovarius indicus]
MLVRRVEDVLELLEFYAEFQKPATISEVSQHFGWPRSSTFNILTTMSSRGYLYESGGKGQYYPTSRLFRVAQSINAGAPLPDAVISLLDELAEDTEETVFLAAPSGLQAVFLEVRQSPHRVRYFADVGGQIPLFATATGQAILSQLPERHVDSILRRVRFERYGPGTPMSIDEVMRSIRQSLRRGYFVSASNYSQDLGGVSVPLVIDGRAYAITVAGPLSRFEPRQLDYVKLLHDRVPAYLGTDFFSDSVKGLKPLATTE